MTLRAILVVAAGLAIALPYAAPVGGADAPPAATYKGSLYVTKHVDGALVCANGGFASVTLESASGSPRAVFTLHSQLCSHVVGAYALDGSFATGWTFAPGDDDPLSRGSGTVGADGAHVPLAFERAEPHPTSGLLVVERASGFVMPWS